VSHFSKLSDFCSVFCDIAGILFYLQIKSGKACRNILLSACVWKE
jgi:hypothetical protein